MSALEPVPDTVSSTLMKARMRHLRATDSRYVELKDRVRKLGVTVYIADIDDDPDLLGYYKHADKMIVLRVTLSPRKLLSTFAHEVGHAVYGHDRYGVPFYERAADQWAARALIDPDLWADHVAVSESVEWLAECFGVTEDVIKTYRDMT